MLHFQKTFSPKEKRSARKLNDNVKKIHTTSSKKKREERKKNVVVKVKCTRL